MTAERGSSSVYVLAAGAVVLLAGTAAAAVGSAMVARHRAEAAADLGALAAASSATLGAGPACSVATDVVRANGARLVGCRLIGADALVTVTVVPAGPAAAWGQARAAARAGPAPESVGSPDSSEAARPTGTERGPGGWKRAEP